MTRSVSLLEQTRRLRLLMAGLVLVCGGAGVLSAYLLRGVIHEQESAAALLRSHMTADMMHDAVRGDVLAILAARDAGLGIDAAAARRDLRDRLETFRGAVAESKARPASTEVATALRAVDRPLTDYAQAAIAIADASQRDPRAAARGLGPFFQRFEQLEAGMEQVTEAIEVAEAERARRAGWLGLGAMAVILLTMAGALGVVLKVARAMRDRLIAPVVATAEGVQKMAAGEFGHRIEGAERTDELGALVRGVEDFRTQLRAAEEAKAAQSTLIVSSIGEGLSALARGDLAAKVSADLQPPFVRLKSDFNAAIAGLSAMVGDVRDSVVTLRLGAREIAEANGEVARRTEHNAASIEETLGALREVDRHVHETAATAGETVTVATDGLRALSAGRSTTDGAVAAMSRVSESAQGIDAVIEGLDKIAFQTRVLAMNAAVEAGRAGEAGRGFAVVADLVSALAMRAEEEAKLARAQLTATQADIGDAVEAVRSVDRALGDIAGNVEAVHSRLQGIAGANERQAVLVGQIQAAIDTMSEATQQNAAMVEESAAAAAALTAQADGLAAISERFVLPPRPEPVEPRRVAA